MLHLNIGIELLGRLTLKSKGYLSFKFYGFKSVGLPFWNFLSLLGCFDTSVKEFLSLYNWSLSVCYELLRNMPPMLYFRRLWGCETAHCHIQQ